MITLRLLHLRREREIKRANSPIMSDEFHIVTGVTSFYTVNAYRVPIRRVARLTTVEVVHGEGGVRRDFV